MFELSNISIEKKDYLDKFLLRRTSKNSEFSFTNLFMWRKSYSIKYIVIYDMLCIFLKHADGPISATFPIGFVNADGSEKDVTNAINFILDWFDAHGYEPLIRLYDDRAVKKLTNTFTDKFILTEDRNNFDYVYKIEDLVNLSGKKYHAKRNHINKFINKYPNFEYCRMTPENAQECIDLFDSWRNSKDDGSSVELAEEREAIIELLDNWDCLGVTGGCIKIDGKMVAFSFGEALSNDTVVIHLEHADTSYEGIFAVMNQQFLENEWQSCTFVNREEDMGIPGMRKAKQSYHPAFMVEKYVATLA